MKHGEAPWLLMCSGPLLFTFGLVWAWLVDRCLTQTVTLLDMPVRSALLVGAGTLGTLGGQFGMLLAWRRYVRAIEAAATCRTGNEVIDDADPVVPSAVADLRTGEARRPGTPSVS